MDEITKILREKNLKATSQRIAVYNALYITTAHPTAEMIYKKVLQDNPSMSFATVYKTLSSFCEVNIIQELSVGQNSFRYDANIEPHPHLICVKCRSVFDLHNVYDAYNKFKQSVVELNNDIELLSEQMNFFGVCQSCKTSDIREENKNIHQMQCNVIFA